jgi:hypothetical protein
MLQAAFGAVYAICHVTGTWVDLKMNKNALKDGLGIIEL